MYQLGVTTAPTEHASTMPIGSGNEGWGWTNGTDTHFYGGANDEIVGTEDNKNIGLESET